jgi:predicted HicB family RNase H-like nuclease
VPPPTKPKKVGRPKLPKGEAMGKIVPIRFAPEDLKAVTAAAKASNQSISQWIRSTLNAAIQG